MHRKKWASIAAWLGGIVTLFLLYICGLGTNPPGFYVDEAALSYNAYLFSRTGAGEFGGPFPVYFELFTGDFTAYTSPSQIYLLGIFFLFAPPTILSARLFSAFWVFVGCILLGFLAKRISKSLAVAIIVSLTALLTPWLFDIRGLLLEAHFMPFAITILLIGVYRATLKESWSWFDAASIASGLCLITYCYTAGRGLSVLLAGGLAIFATKRSHLVGVIKTWLLYAIGLLPIIIYNFQNPGVLSRRLYEVSSFKPEMSLIKTITVVTARYFEDLGLTALLLNGDYHPRHHVPGSGGAIYFATFFLGILGLIVLIARRKVDRWWLYVAFGLLASVVPGALANEPFHQLRMIGYPVFFLLLTVPAIDWLFNGIEEFPFAGSNTDSTASTGLDYWVRHSLLILALSATIIQATSYMLVVWSKGPDREFHFDVAYRTVYEAAVDQPKRPIFLEDGMWGPRYISGLWYAVEEGRPTSEFVHLLAGQRPPPGSIVISSEEPCRDCQIIQRNGSYTLYVATPPR